MLASIAICFSVLLFAGAMALLAAALLHRLRAALMLGSDGAHGREGQGRLRGRLQRWLQGLCAARIPDRYLRQLRAELIRAGEPGRLQPEEVVGLQLAGAIGGGALGMVAGLVLGGGAALLPLCVLLGLLYPRLSLRETRQRRQRRIARELPSCLDLLTLSVEAGLDFSGALAKVVEKGRPSALRDELALVLKELRMGRCREDALRGLLERIDLPAIRSFVGALVQADRMGSSLGKVLRLQAAQLREARSQRAEKLAGEAPVKLLFPLIACIFPTIFLVLFGPIAFAMLGGGFGG